MLWLLLFLTAGPSGVLVIYLHRKFKDEGDSLLIVASQNWLLTQPDTMLTQQGHEDVWLL